MSRLPAAEQAAVPVLPAMLTPLRESAEALPDVAAVVSMLVMR